MLNVFERERVVDVLCVVTRYFGGILLGAGGLCRAYTKAAKDALDAAGISKMQPWLRQQITVSYALFERAKLLIAAQEGTCRGRAVWGGHSDYLPHSGGRGRMAPDGAAGGLQRERRTVASGRDFLRRLNKTYRKFKVSTFFHAIVYMKE